MEKLKSIFICLFILNLIGCIPQMETVESENLTTTSVNAETLLSKSSTGQQSLKYLNQLRSSGYVIQFKLVDKSEIHAANGHNGGGYKVSGSNVTIYISDNLPTEEQAHVIAHELVHISDDFEIDQYLQNYSYVTNATQDFVTTYKSKGVKGISNASQNVMKYVLGTLFCLETRAYTKNQELSEQGIPTNYFTKGSTLSQFIDQNYI